MLHFFLSYAHGDWNDNSRVQKFFIDLSTEIRVLVGEDGHVVVGFHDDGALRVGDDWPRELVLALSRAQTMLALCSPRYFRSQFCGKEWAVFSERIRRWELGGAPRRPRLIPIFWVWTKVPEFLDHVHHRDASFGAAYERDGLRELMREDGRDYTRFLRAVALRIVSITGEGDPMATFDLGADLRSVSSAFHPAAVRATPAQEGAASTVGNVPNPRPASDKLSHPVSGPVGDGVSGPVGNGVSERVDDPHQPRPILSLEVAEPAEPAEGPERDPGQEDERSMLTRKRWGSGHDRR